MKKFVFSVLMVLICIGASAKLSVKYPCSDGMVLQQNTLATVWGHSSPGAKIVVTTSWNAKEYSVQSDDKGVWKISASTPEASYTPYQISIKGDGDEMTIRDVLIGEVWLATGQSNMQMPIEGFYDCPVEGSLDVIAAAPAKNKIRMFTVYTTQTEEKMEDVTRTKGWECAEPATVGRMSATAYFFARQLNTTLDVPVGIVAFARGGARIESWLPKEILATYGTEDLTAEGVKKRTEWTRAYEMYNGMEYPLRGYTAKGFIWYQGCSNVGEHERFVSRMTDLVNLFRSDWGDRENNMPFYQVELAPYIYTDNQAGWGAQLRQAQHQAAASIPNSAIIGTNDLAYSFEGNQIHPRQKENVGKRLAYLALHRDYGFESIPCYSPEAKSASVSERMPGVVIVKLDNCANGLDRYEEIQALEVCGSDGVFKAITSANTEGGNLIVRCDGISDPCEIRYGWGDFVPGNLHSAEGLPLIPFDFKLK